MMKGFARVVLLLLISCSSVAEDIEEPEWQLLDTLDKVELRLYSANIQAHTRLDNSGETSAGFRRLAGFIFGGNDRSQAIAMTAPVQQTLQGSEPLMAFTLPAEYALKDLPAPDDDRVVIVEVPEKTFAVIGFSGWATAAKVARYSKTLLKTLQQNSIAPVGAVNLNQYDPPWTLPFLRRNEISVEIPSVRSAALR